MIASVRVRLALWHTATLAILLIGFAVATYLYLGRTSLKRTDRLLAEAASAFVGEMGAESGDEAPGLGAAREAANDFRLGSTRILLFDFGYHLVAAGPVDARRSGANPTQIGLALARLSPQRTIHFTLPGREGGYRAYVAPAGSLLVVAVQSLEFRRESLEGVRTTFLLAIPLALLLAGTGGYLLARRTLGPVVMMSSQAGRISAWNLHERLPVPNPDDELGQLASILNDLLDRLGTALDLQRRFMADAAHELRTPVAILRGEIDIALSRDERPSAEYREALGIVRAEGLRLSGIIEDLFLLARADAGQRALRPTELYLNELAAECIRSVRSLAAAKAIELRCNAGEDAPFLGDEELLRRLFLNLLDNAVKYSPAGAVVDIAIRRTSDDYEISVRDTGAPIAKASRNRIFDRFFRLLNTSDGEASSHSEGAGLGLSIARWIAEAHGGSLSLAPATDSGNEFLIRLPFRHSPEPLHSALAAPHG